MEGCQHQPQRETIYHTSRTSACLVQLVQCVVARECWFELLIAEEIVDLSQDVNNSVKAMWPECEDCLKLFLFLIAAKPGRQANNLLVRGK